jgi:hypothetical protein
MTDPIDEVLNLVASGLLSAEQAAPILDALEGIDPALLGSDTPRDGTEGRGTRPSKAIRIEISEEGRKVVNLRVPLALGRMAIDHVPGLSPDTINRIREALDEGLTGPVLIVDDGESGGGVRIVIE